MRTRPRFAMIVAVTSLIAVGQVRADPQLQTHLEGVMARPGFVLLDQPDGTVVKARNFGGPAHHWLETMDGYTIQQNRKTGFFEFVRQNAKGELELTGLVVGRDDPEAAGLGKNARPSKEVLDRKLAGKGKPGSDEKPGVQRAVYPNSGTVNVLVIPVYWTNNDSTTATITAGQIADLFDNGDPAGKTVRNYYDEVSYGLVDINASVTAWIQLPNDVYAYDETFGNPNLMAADAIDILFNNGFDFSPFDNLGNGIIGPIIIFHEGFGQEDTGLSRDIWSHYSWLDPYTLQPYNVDSSSPTPGLLGLSVYDYFTVPEMVLDNNRNTTTTSIGVIVHEMGHGFGLRDLYDTRSSLSVLGSWAVMAGGSWNGIIKPGDTPAHMCAWSKMQLGWIEEPTIGNGMQVIVPQIDITLPNFEENARILRIPQDAGIQFDELLQQDNLAALDLSLTTESLVLENRQPIGFDVALPNHGLLVYHIDDAAPGNTLPFPPMGRHRRVVLLEADGQDDILRGINQGDNTDPFPGYYDVRAIGPYSDHDGVFFTPSTNHYARPGLGSTGDTNILIENISDPLPTMTMDVRFLPNLRVHPSSTMLLTPVLPPVTFRNGSTRPVFVPGNPLDYILAILNMDDNFPYAFFCEEAQPFWLDLYASRTGGLTRDEALTRSKIDSAMPGNTSRIAEGGDPVHRMPTGSYSVIVNIDEQDEIRESGELDNRWIAPRTNLLFVNARTGADLAIRDFSFGPMWAAEGDTLQLGGIVENIGTDPAGPFWIEFWGSFNWPGKHYPSLDFLLCDSAVVISLAPGETFDLSGLNRTLYRIPYHDPSQEFSLGCVVDRVDSQPEVDDTNNFDFVGPLLLSPVAAPESVVVESIDAVERTVPAKSEPTAAPALRKQQFDQAELTCFWSTTTATGMAPPADVQVNISLRNWGLTPAPPSWTHVYLSRDAFYSADDYVWVAGLRTTDILPGTDFNFMVPTTAPPLPHGVYYMLVQCDVLNEVPEEYENNNIHFAGRVIVGTDLTFEIVEHTIVEAGFYAPLGLEFGEPNARVDFSLRVVNRGIVASGPAWIEFFGSRLGGLTLDQFLCNSEVIPGLGPLQKVDIVYPKRLYSRPDAHYTVVAVIDRTQMVQEVFEANNRVPSSSGHLLHLRPIRGVDLWVPEFKVPTPLISGGVLKMNGSVANNGTEHTGPFWIEIWGSYDMEFPQPDFLICEAYSIDNLRPGQRFFIRPYQKIAYSGLPKGEFAIICFVDRDDGVMEYDETNNYRIVRFVTIP